ncbi:replicative DNA helicase [Mycoplasma zalophidermidis]|uniref:Replicative DNA helicase n=1 Tax=Mycoplasma zalophidermidis TaxID=398174 RepID=A0ABS6DSB7_9MOLU|nr:replicative DNA helicase [Mycoplasma zalophidermidis]MBU4689969.1 replicative DNA helicase [Mycoplasma zalophidermidis]MBU4693917.1 replicative DNA helicase [Mycoplasma zalophidermidis]
MLNKPENSSGNSIHINVLYEKNILGVVLSDNKYADNVIPYLLEEDFAVVEHKRLFIVLSHLYKNNISINNQQILELAKKTNETLVTPMLLTEVYASAGLPSNIQNYLEELIKLTKLRTIQARISEMQNQLNRLDHNLDENSLINQIQKLLMDVDRAKDGEDFLTAKSVSDEYYDELNTLKNADPNSIRGIPTGFKDIDVATQGLHGSELLILAARPGIGKTALALNIAVNVARSKNKVTKRNRRVAFFSLEMSPKQLMGRIYSFMSGVDQYKLKKPQLLTDDEILKINATKNNWIDRLNLFIDNTYENELQTLLWKCRRLHKVEPIDLIVVDYLQLISSTTKGRGGENRQLEITRISRSLKTLSLELNVPILVLSQLNRQTETREDKRPMLADLRESGSIENDADIVMFLYRENYYNSKNKDIEVENESKNIGEVTELILAKHRNGQTGKIGLRFLPHIGKFTDINFYDEFKEIEGDN